MFFIMGINQGQKQLSFSHTIICNKCGKYGRYDVFMVYTYLSLFFIPVFKWGKRYIVKTSCCNTVYELDSETGKQIAKGIDLEIQDSNLTPLNDPYITGFDYHKKCQNCGYEADADFDFCPKCGNKL